MLSSDQGHGETLSDVLRRDLNRRFSSIDLVPDQTRASVIARTQPRSVITSTPTNSPPPAIPPRTCQSLGLIQIVPPHPTSCSPTCSELSSINGEVFIESDYSEVSRLHPSLAAPGTTLNPQVTIVTKTMEAAKAEISKKNKKLMFKMNNFEPEDIDSETIDDYRDKLLGIETLHEDLVEAIDQFTTDHSDEIDNNEVDHWKNQLKKLQDDVREHRNKVKKKAIEVRQAMATQAVQTSRPNPTNSSMETEKLELLRRQVQALEVANQTAQAEKAEKLSETARESGDKRNAALAKANARYASIDDDISEMEEKVIAVEDWSKESNLSIGRAMRCIKSWKEEFQRLMISSRELKELTSEHDFTEEEINISYQERVVVRR